MRSHCNFSLPQTLPPSASVSNEKKDCETKWNHRIRHAPLTFYQETAPLWYARAISSFFVRLGLIHLCVAPHPTISRSSSNSHNAQLQIWELQNGSSKSPDQPYFSHPLIIVEDGQGEVSQPPNRILEWRIELPQRIKKPVQPWHILNFCKYDMKSGIPWSKSLLDSAMPHSGTVGAGRHVHRQNSAIEIE